MEMNGSLESRVVERVATLIDFLALGAAVNEQERQRAYRAVAALPSDFSDIHVSLRWKKQFPEKDRYGHAVKELTNLLETGPWNITVEFDKWMPNLLESSRAEDRIRKVNPEERRLFVFLAIREAKLTETVVKTSQHLKKEVFPLRLWDYLCLAHANPEPLRYRPFVAIGDRVEVNMLGDFRHAPCVLVRKSSMKLEPVSLYAQPNGTDRYHMVAQMLDV